MRRTVLYGPRDIRFEDRETPGIEASTYAVIRMVATCVCGSDLWPYCGLQPIKGLSPIEGRGPVLRPRPPARRPRPGPPLPARADRPGAEPKDRPGKGVRPDPAAEPGGRG